jgi:hypothetical protein
MKTPGHNIDFLIDPEIVFGIDPINDYSSASKLILNLITSKFPAGSFSYPQAKAGKPPPLACNPYPTTKGDIQVCLFVLGEKHENGWLQCGILTWLHPPSSLFRSRYKPDEIDIQLVADLAAKLEAILVDHLRAQKVIIRNKAM